MVFTYPMGSMRRACSMAPLPYLAKSSESAYRNPACSRLREPTARPGASPFFKVWPAKFLSACARRFSFSIAAISAGLRACIQ